MVRLTGKKHMEKLLTEICYLLIESINTLTSWRDEQNENMVNGQAFVLTRQPTQPSSGLPLSATMGRAEQLYGL